MTEDIREKVARELIKTLTDQHGAGSDLTSPEYLDGAFEKRVEIDQGNGGTIDIDHLTSDVIRMIDEAKIALLEHLEDVFNRRNQATRETENIENRPYMQGRADGYESAYVLMGNYISNIRKEMS